MNPRIGYSLRLEGNKTHVAKIASGDSTPYRVEALQEFEPHVTSASLIDELSHSRSRVMQYIDMDEVHVMLTALPPLKPRALMAALQGAVVRDKGGRPGDWVISQTRLKSTGPQADRNSVELCVANAPLVVVSQLFGKAMRLGCRPLGMLPDFLALEELFRRHGMQEEDRGAWSLVYLGEDQRFLCVGDEDCLLFERPLPEDLSRGKAPEEYLEHLITEIERSISFAQQAERSLQIQRVVICGDPQLSVKLQELLEARSDIAVRHWRLEDIFAAAEGEQVWRHALDLARAAAALQGSRYEILPPGVKRGPGRILRRKVLVAVLAFVAASLPLALAGGWLTTRVQNRYLEHASEQRQILFERATQGADFYAQNRALKNRQDNVQRYSGSQPDLARMMQDLSARTPESVALSTLDIERGPDESLLLVLRGESKARTGEQAQRIFMDFLSALSTSSRLQELSEPVFVEISGVSEAEKHQSQVAFTLKYRIRESGS